MPRSPLEIQKSQNNTLLRRRPLSPHRRSTRSASYLVNPFFPHFSFEQPQKLGIGQFSQRRPQLAPCRTLRRRRRTGSSGRHRRRRGSDPAAALCLRLAGPSELQSRRRCANLLISISPLAARRTQRPARHTQIDRRIRDRPRPPPQLVNVGRSLFSEQASTPRVQSSAPPTATNPGPLGFLFLAT